ncbi:hypothetical protein [Streptomyces chartreusis]|uniref:hypothetical protein n=1 Tax=Streptomyces chartreusis TaxID=1969 RepID=UPI0035D7E5E0
MPEFPEPVPTDAAYQYELGSCSRCRRNGTQVTRIGDITSGDGETPLWPSRECVQELLTRHERTMERMDTRPRVVQLARIQAPRGVEAD